ncbi:uncharacterized protein LOC134829819 [Culicoides brevitarsis]|uniref:uncharacterized protein LOC134829819 n=1 Tax=Culicoides brevitarsis TaxID=469753 RepID=UPI00307B543D
MDTTTLRQRSAFMTSFPGRKGIFNSPFAAVNHRNFATSSSANALPYLGVVHDSSADTVQGHHPQQQSDSKSDMGGLVSILGSLPLVGVVQKLFTSFFSPAASPEKSKMEENRESPKKCSPASDEPMSISTYIKNLETNCDNCGDRDALPRKRTTTQGFVTVLQPPTAAQKRASPFNPNHFYHKSKVAEKNRLEKQRHNIRCDIHDDFDAISSGDDDDFDPITDETQFASFEIAAGISPKLTVVYKSSPDAKKSSPNGFIFSLEDFPVIPERRNSMKGSPKRTPVAKASCYRRQDSLSSATDDDFVVFDHDSVQNTPSSGTGQQPSLKSLLINRLKCRQRQISECSDDSCVIFFDHDGQSDCWSDEDLSEAEEADETSSDDDEDDDSVDTLDANRQPDSGFDEHEKKVRFNLKPEVHVMRTWDYAYRRARVGPWECCARDRERFNKRIADTEKQISHVFAPEHRQRIYEERFSAVN